MADNGWTDVNVEGPIRYEGILESYTSHNVILSADEKHIKCVLPGEISVRFTLGHRRFNGTTHTGTDWNEEQFDVDDVLNSLIGQMVYLVFFHWWVFARP